MSNTCVNSWISWFSTSEIEKKETLFEFPAKKRLHNTHAPAKLALSRSIKTRLFHKIKGTKNSISQNFFIQMGSYLMDNYQYCFKNNS